MKIITDYNHFYIDGRSAVVIGKFDGVHLGHRALLDAIIGQKKKGLQAVVFTFVPSPGEYFGITDGMKLTTETEKRNLLETYGIDYLIEYPMNAVNAAMEPECFIREILAERLHAAFIAAGPDLTFGRFGRGDFKLLESYSAQLDFRTCCIKKLCQNGVEISSTMIRRLLEKGDMEQVAECLGMPYFISGRVAHGAQLGRTIGIPTANLLPEKDKLLPPFGVYYTRTEVEGRTYYGMTNLGCKPTVKEDKAVTIETYLYDFTGNLYDREICVSFLRFRRPEMKFSGIEELKERMQLDLAAGREYCQTLPDAELLT